MVSRARVKSDVVRVLAGITFIPESNIKEQQKLKEDLGIPDGMKLFLFRPFTKISEAHGGKPVRRKDCKKMKTVKNAIDTVHKQSNA